MTEDVPHLPVTLAVGVPPAGLTGELEEVVRLCPAGVVEEAHRAHRNPGSPRPRGELGRERVRPVPGRDGAVGDAAARVRRRERSTTASPRLAGAGPSALEQPDGEPGAAEM